MNFMNNYRYIPYSKKLVSRARELRKDSTQAEEILWEQVLKCRKLLNLKFTRQKPVGDFIVDFYCAELKLAIEVDGEVHTFQKGRDKERDDILREKFGMKIIRYKNTDITSSIEKVKKNLIRKIHPFLKSP
jgi:very-short-patch-repair endonuclease